MKPMQNKTPEERKAIAAKALATRRANINARNSERSDALKYAGGLREKIADMEARISALQRMETLNAVSAAMTGKHLLREDEIVKSALPWNKASGIYFLVDAEKVVYVGQSVDVYSRISQHKDKVFDRYAFVPCPVSSLDRLESLYIHLLQPLLNGNKSNGFKCVPIELDALIGAGKVSA